MTTEWDWCYEVHAQELAAFVNFKRLQSQSASSSQASAATSSVLGERWGSMDTEAKLQYIVNDFMPTLRESEYLGLYFMGSRGSKKEMGRDELASLRGSEKARHSLTYLLPQTFVSWSPRWAPSHPPTSLPLSEVCLLCKMA